MKLDLQVTNATVVDDVIRFASFKSKEKLHIVIATKTRKNHMSLIMMKSKINLRKSRKRKLEK